MCHHFELVRWKLSDLAAPWCAPAAATLRVVDDIAAGIGEIEMLAAALGADCDSLERVLRHLVAKGLFEHPARRGDFDYRMTAGHDLITHAAAQRHALPPGSSERYNSAMALPQLLGSHTWVLRKLFHWSLAILLLATWPFAQQAAHPPSGNGEGPSAEGPTLEEKQRIDAAIPPKAPAKPKRSRRILVSNLTMRDGKPWRNSYYKTIPVMNYAIEQLGKRTGAFQVVFSNDVELFRPAAIRQFDAICFANTVGVLFEDEELRKSLLAYIAGGKGFIGIHDAIATFVQYPKYDQWPAFGQMLGGTENGGHPWNGEVMTLKVDDPASPLTAMFRGVEFKIADQAFQLQEPVFRDRIRVLLSIDVTKTPLAPKRRFLPPREADKDFPVTWVRAYGKGRVFYSGLGHGGDVFWNPKVIEHILAGIQYTLGDLKANDKPIPKQ